jgi:hypothetical protein
MARKGKKPKRKGSSNRERFDKAEWWAKRIGDCWTKSVAAIIQTGQLLSDAKGELNHGEWMYMFEADKVSAHLPGGIDHAERLMALARTPLGAKANSAIWRNLPVHDSTLFVLAQAPIDTLKTWIRDGLVTPKTMAWQARKLLTGDAATEPEPAWWTQRAALERAREFATRELRRCPAGDWRQEPDGTEWGSRTGEVVGHILRAVAHEILTPLAQETVEDLRNELDELTTCYDGHGPDYLGMIRDAGGMKPSRDHPTKYFSKHLPPGTLNNDGVAFDVLVANIAKTLGKPPRQVEREMLRALKRGEAPGQLGLPGQRLSSRPSKAERAALRADIKKLKAILDGRALKTGLVPLYYAGPPIAPEVEATMRAARDRAREAMAQAEAR